MKRIFTFASLLIAAVMHISCEGVQTTGDNALTLTADKNFIQTFGGDYAQLTVKLGDQVVTEGVTFFDGDNNVIDLPGFKFSSETPGDYVIWANCGTSNSDPISIKAISVAIPETPADPQPANTKFKARSMVTEFTTVGCTACPGMKSLLESVMKNPVMNDNIVMLSCHPGLVNAVADPCYVHTDLDDFCASTGFPTVNLDLYTNFSNYLLPQSEFEGLVNNLIGKKEAVAAGIAVNAVFENGQIVLKATMKSAQTGNYRIGAFLLEDGIYARQSGNAASWMHTHDDVIRYVDCKYRTNNGSESYFGHSVGNVAAGSTADYVFAWILDDIWKEGSRQAEVNGGGRPWGEFVYENLHAVVFVTTADADGNYYVNNVIDCPIDGITPFEYK